MQESILVLGEMINILNKMLDLIECKNSLDLQELRSLNMELDNYIDLWLDQQQSN